VSLLFLPERFALGLFMVSLTWGVGLALADRPGLAAVAVAVAVLNLLAVVALVTAEQPAEDADV